MCILNCFDVSRKKKILTCYFGFCPRVPVHKNSNKGPNNNDILCVDA